MSQDQVGTYGNFLSIPTVFKDAEDGIRHALKMEFGTTLSHSEKDRNLNFKTFFLTDRILTDFGAVDPASVDLKRVEKDCNLVKEIIREHPEIIHKVVNAVSGNGEDISEIIKVAESLEKIGFTEEYAHKRGGGFLGLLIVVGAALLVSGCRGCAHGAAGNRPPKHPE